MFAKDEYWSMLIFEFGVIGKQVEILRAAAL